MNRYQIFFLCILFLSVSCSKPNSESLERKFNSSNQDENQNRLDFPIGKFSEIRTRTILIALFPLNPVSDWSKIKTAR